MGFLKAIALVGAVWGVGGACAFGLCVRMIEQAVVVGQEVRVGEIATVTDTDAATAEKIAQTVVVKVEGDSATIAADAVLFAVLNTHGMELAGSLSVRGAASCQVRVEGKKDDVKVAGKGSVAANVAVSVAAEPEMPVVHAAVVGGQKQADEGEKAESGTLAELLIEQAVAALGADAGDVRVSFQSRQKLLEASAEEGQRWVIRPLSTSFLGLVQWDVQLVAANRVMQKATVQARISRRVKVAVASEGIARGSLLTADMVRMDERWIDRQMPTLVSDAADVMGLEAQRPVGIGSVLDCRDFVATDVITRNELVDCTYMAGGLKVSVKARALGAGKLGEVIALKNEANGERIEGTVVGKHMVMLNTPATGGK